MSLIQILSLVLLLLLPQAVIVYLLIKLFKDVAVLGGEEPTETEITFDQAMAQIEDYQFVVCHDGNKLIHLSLDEVVRQVNFSANSLEVLDASHSSYSVRFYKVG